MSTRSQSVIVVGAGIVGACIAYRLARGGASVTLLDAGRPAHGVTSKAFAWINVSDHVLERYADLRLRAIDEYRRLDRDLGDALPIAWCGALTWHRSAADTERSARVRARWGHDVRLVDGAWISTREPNLRRVPECAAYAVAEGAVDPVGATETVVDAAREAGVDVRPFTEVLGLTCDDARVTGARTGTETVSADVVVLAAGVASRDLAGEVGVDLPLGASPATLVRFRTERSLVNGVVSNPDLEIRQPSDTVLLCAEEHIDESIENGPAATARRALLEVREQLSGGDGVELAGVEVGYRPMPRDDAPIVGFAPGVDGLYLASMHSGITLAPIVGRLAAKEILRAASQSVLDECRLERFLC